MLIEKCFRRMESEDCVSSGIFLYVLPFARLSFPYEKKDAETVLFSSKLNIDVYMQDGYNKIMIKTFRDRETEKIYNQTFSKKLPQSKQRIALRKLIMMWK